MQIDRLFGIVYLLIQKQHTTTTILAERFGVSKRTVLRDIDTLTLAGIPLYTAKGKGGGIFLSKDFTLNRTTLSESEQNQIFLALQSLTTTEHIDVSGTLSKLSAVFRRNSASWIEVDFSRWGYNSQDNEKFEILKHAILNNDAVSFTYMSSYGETTDRTVVPLKMVYKSKAWYIQSFCLSKQDYRTFKISRMLCVLRSNEAIPDQISMPPHLESEPTSPYDKVHLHLLFSSHVAHRVYDEFDPRNVIKNADGTFSVKVTYPEDAWLYGFLLSFGNSVRVLEPKNIRESLLLHVDAIKDLY